MNTVISSNVSDAVTQLLKSLKGTLILSCVLLMSMIVSGCATIVYGPNQKIVVNSSPSGATVFIDGQDTRLKTPTVVQVKRKHSLTHLQLTRGGYEPAQVILKRSLNGWVWGNCLFGYGVLPGAIIDLATGAAYRISPEVVSVRLPETSQAPTVIIPEAEPSRMPTQKPTELHASTPEKPLQLKVDNAKQAIAQAQSALDGAKAAGALTYAPDDYQVAENMIRSARSLFDQNQFDQAQATAAQAEKRATTARGAAVDSAQAAAKREAYTNAQTATEKAQSEIRRAEGVNALECAEPLFQRAKTTLEQAGIALKAERYDEAVRLASQAENIAHEAYALAAEFNKVTGKDGTPMVLIPAGEFLMGSENGTGDEKPVHRVYLDAYYMDRFEVTVGRYRKFVEATGHPAPDWEVVEKYSPTDNCPMVLVSWHDAMAYAQWAGKTIPTEAQWEKAARGGLVQKDYPTGNSISHDDANFIRGKTLGLTGGKTVPVNRFSPNGYGLYNMAGNVWEWCLDHYDKQYYRRSPKNNPFNVDEKKPKGERVLRGGSWNDDNLDNRVLRCAYRNHASPSTRDIALGFRCVMPVSVTTEEQK